MARKTDEVTGGNTITEAWGDGIFDETEASARLLAYGDTTTLKVIISPGLFYVGSKVVDFAGGSSGLFSDPSASNRIDVVTIESSGALKITAGVEDDSPSAPAVPDIETPIAEVYLRAGGENIKDSDESDGHGYINKDLRPFLLTGHKLLVVTTDVDVNNTTAEEDLFSVEIPGGTLKAFNAIRIRIRITLFSNDGGWNLAFKLKYGGTTLITSGNFTTGTTDTPGYIEAFLFANNSESAQEGSMSMVFQRDVLTPGNVTAMIQHKVGTSSEDSSADKTLSVTAKWNNANPVSKLKVVHVLVERIF